MAIVRHQWQVGDPGQRRTAAPAPGRRRASRATRRAPPVIPAASDDADIAAHAVEGERAPARLPTPRSASPCRPDGRSRRTCRARTARWREATRLGASAASGERGAAADKEHRHHVAPAPAVGEPAGRQREHAEGDERRGRRARSARHRGGDRRFPGRSRRSDRCSSTKWSIACAQLRKAIDATPLRALRPFMPAPGRPEAWICFRDGRSPSDATDL